MQKISKCIKIISLLTLSLILGLTVLFGFQSQTAFAVDTASPYRTVNAGVFAFEGYHTKDENGGLTGYGIEFLYLVSQYSHLNFNYVGYDHPWVEKSPESLKEGEMIKEGMLTMLENGDIDVVTSASMTPEREEKFDFSLPIGRRKTVLSIQVNNENRIRGNYATYKGMTIGVITGSSQNESLENFAREKGFSYTTKEYEDSQLMSEDLQSGKIDAILSSNLRKAENEQELDIIEEADFYAIVRKGETSLLNEINYAIRQMDINEGDWKNELFYKYYGPVYSSALSFTERERAYLNQVASGEKRITVTAFGNRAPYSFTENGTLKGIIPDYFAEIMKLAAAEMGLENIPYSFVAPYDAKDYASLADGRVNVVLDSVAYDAIEEDTVASCFNTKSYMTVRMARVTRQNHTGEIKTVAVSDSQGKDLIEPNIKGYEIKTYQSGEAALRAVLNNEADVAYVYSYTAQYFINHGHTDSLYYSSVNGMLTQSYMHVGKTTDHELLTILNKCIKQIPDDTLNQLASKYTTVSVEELNFGEYLLAHPEIIVSIVLAIVIIVGVIVALSLHARWNKKLLNTTEQANKEMSKHLSIVEALSRDFINVYAVNEARGTVRIIKMDGYVTEGFNKDTTDLNTEYNYAEILDNFIRQRVYIEDRQELMNVLSLENVKERLKDNLSFMGNYRIIDDEGEIHHYQYTYQQMTSSEDGHESFVLVGFRNIDETIRKEKALQDELANALVEAQYANKAKTTFLSNMSHDIRTPMNAIIGFTNLAANHIDEKAKIIDYLNKIMTSSTHLLNLINNVLDMSRIESGKINIEEAEVCLPEILRELQTFVQSEVNSKQLKLSIGTTELTNEKVFCDKLRLNQVLLNILGNAVKFTKSGGGVSVNVTQSPSIRDGYACYKFSVKDNGIGMSPEFLKHVFEPFEREQSTTVSGIQGTGLGLAITKNIVNIMGGTISVESELGVGSEFTVEFCFKVVEAPAPKSEAEKDVSRINFTGKKMLIVEDNELNLEIACELLKSVGFDIDTASDGSIAVERIKEMPAGTYDVILMDVQMPVMNGYEATKAIRALDDPIKAATPIVAMTANAFEEDKKEAFAAGMNGFTTKPIETEKLIQTLDEILK